MPRLTVKSSTIFISMGGKTQVYRSVEDVPPRLRKRLEQSTNGINSATILIADRRGREEIVRAIRGLPSSVRSRISSTLRSDSETRPEIGRKKPALWRNWVEMLLPAAIGTLVWLLFSLK
ncbi:MAG: hypothetical protein ACR2NN_19110 [Bryobacteraceae bacterium]